MTETAELLRDIERLRESIRLDWQDLDRLALTDAERQRIREHVQICTHDLVELLHRLDEMEDAKES